MIQPMTSEVLYKRLCLNAQPGSDAQSGSDRQTGSDLSPKLHVLVHSFAADRDAKLSP